LYDILVGKIIFTLKDPTICMIFWLEKLFSHWKIQPFVWYFGWKNYFHIERSNHWYDILVGKIIFTL